MKNHPPLRSCFRYLSVILGLALFAARAAAADSKFAIAGTSVTASADDGNVPANTVDGNLATRWSASGDGQWIKYDLGADRRVAFVNVAFYNGTARTFTFDIQTSTDDVNWTTARSGAQSALNNNLQTFDFTDVNVARYVRLVGHGNSSSAWNSYTEVEVWGGLPVAAPPTFSPGGGTYTSAQSVTIATTSSGASIRYTTDGSTPSATVGTVYSAPVSIAASTTLKAIAYGTDYDPSSVTSATYTISSGSNPVKFALTGGAVIASADDGNAAANTVDGNFATRWSAQGDPQWIQYDLGTTGNTVSSVKIAWYSGDVRSEVFDVQVSDDGVSWTTVLQAASSGTTTALETFDFTDTSARFVRFLCHGNTVNLWNSITETEIWGTPAAGGGQTATPTFSPAGGTYTSAQSITIACATSGASIRYTTDGSTPTSSTGTLYSGPVTIGATTTLKAIAYAAGFTDSTVAAATYTISSGTGPFRPFPQHVAYLSGTIKPNNVTQITMDSAVQSKWNTWKSNYLKPAGTGKYYVKFNSAGETVSEAHGYGMLLTVIMAGYDASAKTYFDGLYNYYKAHPSQNNAFLMAWKQNSSFVNVEGADSATDGDMDIAYGLLLADKQWGSGGAINYLQAAKNIINAIMQSDVSQTRWNLKLGDWATGTQGDNTRPSDFMLEHLKAYKAATADARWENVIATTYNVINTIYTTYSPNTGLICDFVVPNGSSWKPAPANFLESAHDGDYNYNSCRTPWRFPMDYLFTGDTHALAEMQKMNAWVKTKTGSNANNILDGYTLGGSTFGTYNSGAFFAPFGVSAMIDPANQSWLNAVWTKTSSSASEGYYEDSIKLLSMIVMSGNYWMP
jgi:endo-1,4-beta-D-glucanase Y